jgi:hypothetical protein
MVETGQVSVRPFIDLHRVSKIRHLMLERAYWQ